MTPLRFAVWNVEWMNDLFGPNDEPPAFRPDDARPYHASGATIRERRDDLAEVIDDLSPDIVVLVEAPNRTSELELFFDQDVAGDWRVQVQHSRGSLRYSKNVSGTWVDDASVYRETADGRPIRQAYPHASDHFAVVATIVPPGEEPG